MAKLLQHVVLMKFPHDLPPDDDDWIRQAVASWPERIGGFRTLRFGSDLTGQRNRGNQYLLFEEFEDEAALQSYQGHPVHKDFAAWITERQVEVTVLDYYVDESTSFHERVPEP